MVLAAGVGSRLDPLTSEVPKPLVPVGGVPVMEHLFRLLREHNFTQICANLHYLPEKIETYFASHPLERVELTFHREDKLSGDAGGVRACRSFLEGGTFIVLSGDLLTDINLTAVVEQHKKKRALASIAIKPVEDVSRFGVTVLKEDGFIAGFQEKPNADEALSNLV
jgi:mannose-1-phosphate guanylyltransferase